MNKLKQTFGREAAKRMIQKNITPDYIKEITGLSEKQIQNITMINESFIGENDHNLRKKYASLHHQHHGYYFEYETRFNTGVDLDTSEFYKNQYIQKAGNELMENIIKMRKHYANTLRLKAMLRIRKHLNDYEDIILACKMPYDMVEGNIYNYDLYHDLKYKMKDFEEKKMILNLLAVEGNLKKIAFICNVADTKVEDVKEKNSMFFKNDRLDLEKLKTEQVKWEKELEYEIAKRTTDSPRAIDINLKISNIKEYELKKFYEEKQKGEEYEIRKEILEKLMQDPHSPQDMSEISGIPRFPANRLLDMDYYNRYFEKYYDKYADEKLIEYKI